MTPIHGDARNVRSGDFIACATPGDWFSGGIRWATASECSHIALVLSGDPATGKFWILEVGWRIRAARIDEFPGREWVAYRPMKAGKPIEPVDGWKIARDTLDLLRADGTLGALYPWWKLPAYLFSRPSRARLLIQGTRQVCSVTSLRSAIGHGCELWVWDDDNRVLVDDAGLVTVTPADFLRACVESGWKEIARTANAPTI